MHASSLLGPLGATGHGTDDGASPLVLLAPTRGERRRALGGRVLRTAAQVLSPSSAPGDQPGAGRAPVRAVLASKLLTSKASIWSVASMWSAASLYSAGSFGSVMSIGSAGSVLSIGSVGSILSIGSAGSVLSIGSAGSIGAIGGLGARPGSPGPCDDDEAARPPGATLAAGARALAVAALVAAAVDRR